VLAEGEPQAPPLEPAPGDLGVERAMVGVAGAAAFTFGYTEQVELLETAGLDVASLAGQSRLFVVWGEHS